MVAREVRFWMKEKVKEGVPIARVAREYGVSRQTIYNLLAAASSPAKQRKARESRLDPFKSHIVFHPLPSVYNNAVQPKRSSLTTLHTGLQTIRWLRNEKANLRDWILTATR